MQRTVVVDIETVPDHTLWEPEAPGAPKDPNACEKCGIAMTEAENKTRKCTKMERGKCRFPAPAKAADDEFAPLYAYKVITIGWAVLEDGVPKSFDAAVASDDAWEADLINGFGSSMLLPNEGEAPPVVVSWAGRRFDLQVMRLRALNHGLTLGWDTEAHRRQYDESRHVDLAAVLSDHSRDRIISLDRAGASVGLRVKNGVDGSSVKGLAAAGQWDTISDYCKRDVVATTYLYLRYRLLRGQITREQYQEHAFALNKLHTGQPGMDGLVFSRKKLLLED